MIEVRTFAFDTELKRLHHYQAYPEMLPFVGCHYGTSHNPRILLVAESHYFPKGSTVPLASDWYAGTHATLSPLERGYINTGELVGCGKSRKWGSAGMRMFGNIEREIIAGGLPDETNAFAHVAFMNAFQRPARFRSSFKEIFDPIDAEVSAEAICHTIRTIGANWVCVLSSFSWEKLGTLIRQERVTYETTSHALCAWWHRSARGRPKNSSILKDFIKEALAHS